MKKIEKPPREVDKFRGLARQVIKHHFDKAKQLKYLSGGLTNFVFSFRVGKDEYVIRVSPEPQRVNLFIKEQWATAKAKEVGIPVAEILEVGAELIGFPYMVSRSIKGTDATHHPKRLEILKDLGRIGAKINSVRTKGFGQTFDWSDNKLSMNSSFKDWLYNEYDAERKVKSLEKHKLITPERSKRLKKIFQASANSKARPSLNHSDLRLKNVIADDDGKIKALIDWEGCTSNIAPAWELSLALHDLGPDETQYFLDGYGIKPKKLEESIPLVRAFNIANYATAVEELAKDKKQLEHYRLRLSGMLDLYSI
jgi:aminoglycoside phosphotransferase (APT) family kinase protein